MSKGIVKFALLGIAVVAINVTIYRLGWGRDLVSPLEWRELGFLSNLLPF